MPISLQSKLLRFLQERVIERLGGHKEIPIDTRVVCATHQDLKQLISEEKFREDLFYRINEVTINLPPLRDRGADIILLAKHFVEQFAEAFNPKVKGFSPESLSAMMAYQWPGNIRELENRVKRSVIMADSNYIEVEDLEIENSDKLVQSKGYLNLRQVRETAEKSAIKQAMMYCDGNMTKVAQILGITRPTLYATMEKYQMRETK